MFVQAELDPLNVNIREIACSDKPLPNIMIEFDNIFPSNAKLLPTTYLNGMLQDHLTQLGIDHVIATDASMNEEKAGVGIFSESLSWSYAVRLPDFTPIFLAELAAIILALRKLPSNYSTVVIVTDSLSVCTSLTSSADTTVTNTFKLLTPPNLSLVRLVWVPGHRGIFLNEMADTLARISLDGPVMSVMPSSAYVTAARFRKFSLLQDSTKLKIQMSEFNHLSFSWDNKWCPTRKLEISVTKLRCRITPLNFYLHRSGLAPSPLCPTCQEPENIDHFLLFCHRFRNERKKFEFSFRKLGISLTTENILSFGASSLGFSHRNICVALCDYICDTKRLPS